MTVQVTSPYEQLPLFVYGTLRPGEANFQHFLQGHTTVVRPATIRGRLYWTARDNYPYLVEGNGTVIGEVIWVASEDWPQVITAIDRLEEYDPDDEENSWYVRRVIEARDTDHNTVLCWAYFWNRPWLDILIAEGDWKNRR